MADVFNVFCRFVERYLPEIKDVVEYAKLFYVDNKEMYKGKEGIINTLTVGSLYVPYTSSIFIDTAISPPGFLLIYDTSNNLENAVILIGSLIADKFMLLDIDALRLEKSTPGETYNFKLKSLFLYDVKKDTIKAYKNGSPRLKDMETEVTTLTNSQLTMAFTALNAINKPHYFIVEEKPVLPKKQNKSKKIKRSHQRPHYTVLHSKYVRSKIGLPEPNRSGRKGHKKRPHDRRRVVAFLQDDIYRFDNDGKPIEPKIIPWGKDKGRFYYKISERKATWVGPDTNQIGNKIYRVILDK